MATTINYQFDLPNPRGIQINEVAKIATSLIAIDAKLKLTETALSTHKHSFADLLDRPNTLGGYGITDGMTATEVAAAIQQAVSDLVNGSGAALDTLKELADALGNDPQFATTVSNALALRIRVDAAQSFNLAQKAQGRSNLDALGIVDKGKADGVASLDGNGKVPAGQLPSMNYLPLAGGTMTGPVALPGNPTANLHAATKQYVDSGDASANANANGRVSKAGDLMSGALNILLNAAAFSPLLNLRNAGAGDVALRMAGGGRDFDGAHIEIGQRANGDLFLWNGAGIQWRFTKGGQLMAAGDIAAGVGNWVYSGFENSSSTVRSSLRPTTVVAGNTGVLFADGNLQGSKWGGGYLSDFLEARSFWRSEDWAKSRNRADQGTYTIARFRYPGYSRNGNDTISGSELTYASVASEGSNSVHGGIIDVGTWKLMSSGGNSTGAGSNQVSLWMRIA
ncbi:hypothetical protein EDF68_104152 [Ochrobactrum sp. BH3]|nr:hypothetical protein EDF68_104152 [Ochrobactrum sp. BH3]